MSISSLKNLLDDAKTNNTYVIGFVVQGWEDACSFVEASTNEQASSQPCTTNPIT